MSNKWVEVEAKTIDDAIKAGLKELQLDDATEADISILREPEGGVFGVGGTKALVRISVRGGFKTEMEETISKEVEMIDQKKPKRKNLNQKNQELKRIQKSNWKYQFLFYKALLNPSG